MDSRIDLGLEWTRGRSIKICGRGGRGSTLKTEANKQSL